MTKSQSTGGYIAKLTLILFLITAVVALLLGAVNAVTADKIDAIKAEKTAAAMREVLAADAYDELGYTGDDATVAAIYAAADQGYVVEVKPSGFGGEIDMMVGIGADGTVTGVSIIDMSETSGLGANAAKDTFRDQYKGLSGTLAVSKDGGTIDALTGATVTSRAVTRGVNSALAAAASLS